MSITSSSPTIHRGRPNTSDDVGSVPTGIAGVVATEYGGSDIVRKTVFTFTNFTQAIVDATTNGAHGGTKIYDFPTGALLFVGTPVTKLTIARVGSAIAAGAAVVASLGSATVANTNATLTSTEADILPSTASTLSSGTGNVYSSNSATLQIGASASNAATDMYLNFAIPDADCSGNDSLTVNGTIEVTWILLGSR